MLDVLENTPFDGDGELNDEVCDIMFHCMIVSNLAYKIGQELGFDSQRCLELAYAGILHDIGKIRLNAKLATTKMGMGNTFSAEEIQYVRNHSKYGYKALREMGCSDYVLEAVLFHHENYDGTGYPDGLNGSDIPEGARVLRVCDVFAALMDRRIYRESLSVDVAVETMIDEVKNFDMKIFLAFQRVIHRDDVEEVFGWIAEHNEEVERKYEEKKNKKMKKRKKRKYASKSRS